MNFWRQSFRAAILKSNLNSDKMIIQKFTHHVGITQQIQLSFEKFCFIVYLKWNATIKDESQEFQYV